MTALLDHEEQYRRDHLNHILLDAVEEARLLELATRGNRAAIADLVESNQRLVMMVAARYFHSGMAGDLDLMDLVGWGNQGLLEALRRWDTGRGLRFSTYATYWIRALIRRNAITRGLSLSRTSREADLLILIRRARSRLLTENGQEPTPAEIARRSGISLRLVNELLSVRDSAISLDQELHDGLSLESTIPGPEDTAHEAELSIDTERLHCALAAISPKYAYVLRLRYGLTDEGVVPYSEIARRLNVSRARIQEIERIALTKLRKFLSIPG